MNIITNGKSPLADLMPGRQEVLVGEQVLILREPVLAKLNQAWEAVDDADLHEAIAGVKKIFIREPVEGGANIAITGMRFIEDHFDSIISVLRKGIVPLITKKLPAVIAIALDTKANRLELQTNFPELGIVNSDVFKQWVIEEITTPQTLYVLETLKALSGWEDLSKRLWKLFAGTFQKTEKPAVDLQVVSETSLLPSS